MTSLFHFEDNHHKSLPRVESTPLLFLRLLCQVLENIGFPEEPRLERHRDCEVVLTVDRWHTMPRYYHLPPPDLVEGQPTADIPPEDQPPTAEHIEEPQAPTPPAPASAPPTPTSAPPAPATTAPVPPTLAPSVSSVPSTPMSTTHSNIVGLNTSAEPQQSITISTRDFFTIMDAVRTFSSTSASFATAHAALEDRMTHTEAAMAQTSAILA